MNCPACGAERPRGAAFCGSCGRPFGDYSIGSPSQVAPRLATAPSAAVTNRVAPAYAGFWLRFVAHLIDGLIVLFGAVVLALLILAIVGVKFFRTLGEAGKEPDAATLSPNAKAMSENMYRALWSWMIAAIVPIVVSWATKPKPESELVGLVRGCTELPSEGHYKLYQRPIFWAGVVFVVFIVLNVIFW